MTQQHFTGVEQLGAPSCARIEVEDGGVVIGALNGVTALLTSDWDDNHDNNDDDDNDDNDDDDDDDDDNDDDDDDDDDDDNDDDEWYLIIDDIASLRLFNNTFNDILSLPHINGRKL